MEEMKQYKKLKMLNYFLLALLTLLVILMLLLLAPAWKRIFSEMPLYNKGELCITFSIPIHRDGKGFSVYRGITCGAGFFYSCPCFRYFSCFKKNC
jgi:hypothetical protein